MIGTGTFTSTVYTFTHVDDYEAKKEVPLAPKDNADITQEAA